MRRILFSASDVGTAEQMVPLIQLMRDEAAWQIHVCASVDAAKIFEAHALPIDTYTEASVKIGTLSPKEKYELIAFGNQIIENFCPQITISGLSNFGNGLDESIIHGAKKRGIKSCLLMDDFGPIFTLDGEIADIFLATTSKIFQWCSKYESKTYLLGSPKHEGFTQFPSDLARLKTRKFLEIDDKGLLITFFAQNDRMRGHNYNFQVLCEVLREIQNDIPEFNLVVRPHPGAPSGGEKCYNIANSMGLPCSLDDPTNDVLKLLCASDVVLSCISTCLTDFLWLKLGARSLRGYPIYLLIGQEIKIWLDEFLEGPWCPEIYDLGLAYMPKSADELASAIKSSILGVGPIKTPPLEALRSTGNSTQNFMSIITKSLG